MIKASYCRQRWLSIQSAFAECAEKTIGRKRGNRKEQWIKEETWNLIDSRKVAKIKRDQDLEKNRVIFQVVNILLKNFNDDSWEGVQDNLEKLGYTKDTTLNITQLKPIVLEKLQELSVK